MKVLKDPNATLPQKTLAGIKVAVASERFVMRLLGALDSYSNSLIRTHYEVMDSMGVAKRAGIKPGVVAGLLSKAQDMAGDFRSQGQAMGLTDRDLDLHVQDRIQQSFLGELAGKGVDVEQIRQAARSEANQITGMGDIEGGGKMKGVEGGGPWRLIPGAMQMLLDLTNKPGWGGLFAKTIVPIIKTPFNVAYGEAGWYVPGWGALRFLKDAAYRRFNDGKTLYPKSLGSAEMYARRMIGQGIGIGVAYALLSLLKSQRDKPEDERWFRLNTVPPQDKEQAKAWYGQHRVPFSVQVKIDDKWVGMALPEFVRPLAISVDALDRAQAAGKSNGEAAVLVAMNLVQQSVFTLQDLARKGQSLSSNNEEQMTQQAVSSVGYQAARAITSWAIPFKGLLSSIDDLARPEEQGKPDVRGQSLQTQALLQVPFARRLGATGDVPEQVNQFGDTVGVGPNFIGIVPSDKSAARFRLPIFISQDVPQEKRALYQLMVDRAKSPSQPPTIKALSKSAKREISTEEYAEFLRVRGEHLFDALARVGADRLRGLDDEGLKKEFHDATVEATDRAKRVVR